MRSFEIYGKWSVQRTSIDTHTCVQCSHNSVGLAQARPNYAVMDYLLYLIVSNFDWLHNSKCVIITCFPRNQFVLWAIPN